jgi:putative inorganic carbon (HCO3(-)) transporter
MPDAMPYRNHSPSLLLFAAERVVSLELIWPLPLLLVGIGGVVAPVAVGAALALAALPWSARWLVFGRPTRRVFVGGALALFVASAVAGMWATYDLSLSWPMLLTIVGSVCLFFTVVNSPTSPWRVSAGLAVAAGLMAFYFAGQYAHFDYQGEGGLLARLGRLTGSLMPNLVFFTPHPNAVAGFLEGAFLLDLVLAWHRHGIGRLAWGLAATITAYGLLISQSRGAWIGLGVVLVISVLLSLPNWTERLVVGVLVFAGGLLGLFAITRLVPSNQEMLTLDSALQTAGSRFVLYRNSLNLFGDYLFTGIGLGGTFAMVYSRYQLLIQVPFLSYSHNLFLSVGLGQGLLGLVALVWLLVSFYYFVGRVERADLDAQSLPLFRAAWLGATVTLVHGLADAPQFSDARWTMPMLFALLGLAIAIGRPALTPGAGAQVDHHRRRWSAIAVFSAILIIIALAVFGRPLLSDWYANLGAVYQTRADLSPGLPDATREEDAARAKLYFEHALSLNPTQPVANRRLGQMALQVEDFERAVVYLEQAYPHEMANQATLKALGYAYLWSGRLEAAEALLRQLDDQSELVEELGNWAWWWDTQNRADRAAAAAEMARRLSSAN